MLRLLALFSLGLLSFLSTSSGFQSNPSTTTTVATTTTYSSSLFTKTIDDDSNNDDELSFSSMNRKIQNSNDRRSFLSSGTARIMGLSVVASSFTGNAAYAADEAEVEEESFASIAARASKMTVDSGERAPTSVVTNNGGDGSKLPSEAGESTPTTSAVTKGNGDTRTAYDFALPIVGRSVPFKDIIKQKINEETGRSKVKVILVSNMKEDDPVARKDIPEFISLAAKYGRDGEFAVILSPTDQGYYEPDTSQLISLKLASEYGYGLNPACVLTDKVNMLGVQAVPFWRWLQSNCRTPAGLGRVEGNFEKFLIDGQTGLPLRRYPRKYKPSNIKNDIEAILEGRPLPPAGANFREEWRAAAVEAEAGTYRFQKGLNYYD